MAELGLKNRTWARSQFRTLLGWEIGVITFFEKGEPVVTAPSPVVEPAFVRTNMIYDAFKGEK